MKRKFNLYSTLLLVALVVILISNIFNYESSSSTSNIEERLELAPEPEEFATCDTIEGGVVTHFKPTYSVTVNVQDKRVANAPVILSHDASRDLTYKVELQKVKLLLPMDKADKVNDSLLLVGASILVLCIIYMWIIVMVIKLIRSIKRGEVFVSKVAKYLETAGILLMVNYLCQWLLSYLITLHIQESVTIAQYDIVFRNESNPMLLVAGLSLMLISQVILMGKELKEDQDLTI